MATPTPQSRWPSGRGTRVSRSSTRASVSRPEQIARAAVDEDVQAIGISILSGAHGLLVPEVLDRLRAEGVDPAQVPVIVGGVIPEEDERKLLELGVARVYTPKDFDLTAMIGDIADAIPSRP